MIDSEVESILRISELHYPPPSTASSLSLYHLFSLPDHFFPLKVILLLKGN